MIRNAQHTWEPEKFETLKNYTPSGVSNHESPFISPNQSRNILPATHVRVSSSANMYKRFSAMPQENIKMPTISEEHEESYCTKGNFESVQPLKSPERRRGTYGIFQLGRSPTPMLDFNTELNQLQEQ